MSMSFGQFDFDNALQNVSQVPVSSFEYRVIYSNTWEWTLYSNHLWTVWSIAFYLLHPFCCWITALTGRCGVIIGHPDELPMWIFRASEMWISSLWVWEPRSVLVLMNDPNLIQLCWFEYILTSNCNWRETHWIWTVVCSCPFVCESQPESRVQQSSSVFDPPRQAYRRASQVATEAASQASQAASQAASDFALWSAGGKRVDLDSEIFFWFSKKNWYESYPKNWMVWFRRNILKLWNMWYPRSLILTLTAHTQYHPFLSGGQEPEEESESELDEETWLAIVLTLWRTQPHASQMHDVFGSKL